MFDMMVDEARAVPDADARARVLYDALRPDGGGGVTRNSVETAVRTTGLTLKDPRLAAIRDTVRALPPGAIVDFDTLGPVLVGQGGTLIGRALRGDLIVPDFEAFAAKLARIFEDVRACRDGEVAAYIPQLARVDPERYAMAVCTVDGQRFSLGDDEEPYCVQSTCKPVNYAVTLDLLGVDTVHAHVGREPSGRSFNEITLNPRGLPHNPLINAGAIMCASLISPEKSSADRFDAVLQKWRALAGGRGVGFDNAVFLSERDTADRNFALAYFMRENRAFPANADLHAALDLYFQCCSITLDVQAMATVAGTFANGGICPVTDERVFESDTVKNCLSLMASCGMYDFSGEYAFTVGLPAKSGVSGALFIVIPGVCGIAIWSPRLDSVGNSVRGVEFSRRLIEEFPFHTFSGVVRDGGSADPRRTATESFVDEAVHLCTAASRGDVMELRRLVARGADVNAADYDGRTSLHVAASDGRDDAVRFLLKRGADPDRRDRWGNRPSEDAERGGHTTILSLLGGASSHDAPEASPPSDGSADLRIDQPRVSLSR